MDQVVIHIIKPELRGNHCYLEVKAIHNIALVMDFTTLLTDIWIYVESYVLLMSPNEDETGLALLITSRESSSYSYNQARITRKSLLLGGKVYSWHCIGDGVHYIVNCHMNLCRKLCTTDESKWGRNRFGTASNLSWIK